MTAEKDQFPGDHALYRHRGVPANAGQQAQLNVPSVAAQAVDGVRAYDGGPSATESPHLSYAAAAPASGAWKHTLVANAVANLIRNYWAYMVIFCGHFPDGAEKFTKDEFENETQAEWYLRQMLGSANLHAGPVMAFMSGNLCYQFEHHLFPDLPSNRYAEISERVRTLCEKYDLPYTTGPLLRQYAQSFWTIAKLALPDKLLKATADDAPETNSDLKFRIRDGVRESFGVDPRTGRRRGLRTALHELQTGVMASG